MAQKGVKYNFEPGEYVLCFEPDATKARVLYDAKILDYASSRDKRGNWKPEYTVHFQGWNSSWDRMVPETFVQKNSAENRALMKRLAIVARNVKKNRSRKRRIDVLLKQHFKRKMPPESSDDSSGNDNTDGDDDDDDDDSTEVDDYDDHMNENQSTTGDETENIENDDESDNDKEYSDGLELHGPHHVELEMPCELRVKLEDDCYLVNRKKRVVSLPADPNVLTVLEGYVKNFALNILYGTVEKQRLREQQNNVPERNIDLCKEVMDGLRIFFDFALPTILLYNVERAHYEKAMALFKPIVTVKKEIEEESQVPEVTSPRLRSATRHTLSPDTSGGGGGGGGDNAGNDLSSALRIHSPRIIKRERADDFSDEDLPPRRMTRHAYQAEIRGRKTHQDRKHKPDPDALCPSNLEKQRGSPRARSECSDNGVASGETRRRDSLRSSTRHSHPADVLNSSSSVMALSDRLTPPPPLIIPSVISSKASKGSSSPHHTPTYKSRCSTPTLMDQMDKEGMMNGVLAWKLIPDDAYPAVPVAPSHVCGAIHLLRLFVRLPELINQMPIPDSGLKPLIKHLWLLLEYMADNSEELFPDSVYVDIDSGRSGGPKR